MAFYQWIWIARKSVIIKNVTLYKNEKKSSEIIYLIICRLSDNSFFYLDKIKGEKHFDLDNAQHRLYTIELLFFILIYLICDGP